MKEKSILMRGEKSDYTSSFSVFESLSSWEKVREYKVIPEGFYFAVLVVSGKKCVDVYPDLFIQGYRPHSSCGRMHVDKRRYAKFINDEGLREAPDDVVFFRSQLYQIVGKREVELVLKNGECRTVEGATKLTERICKEYSFEKLGDVKRCTYHCSDSSGYFLAHRSYDVWSVLVGENAGFTLDKKVLVIDYLTGIPSIVPYDESHFEMKTDTESE